MGAKRRNRPKILQTVRVQIVTKFLKLKKIFSYLVDIQLDKASTALNPVLDLSLRKGRLYLTTTNAVYSYGDLYDNFLSAFQRMDFSKNTCEDILVLGFGMGSVPYMLESVFDQKFNCTGVEADAKIVEWANEYTIPTLSNKFELVHADAAEYAAISTAQFDLVVVDVFLDDVVPEQFSTTFFLEQVKKRLKEQGILLFNRLVDTEQALEATRLFYEDHFIKVFPQAQYLDVGGNWMLANRPVFKE